VYRWLSSDTLLSALLSPVGPSTENRLVIQAHFLLFCHQAREEEQEPLLYDWVHDSLTIAENCSAGKHFRRKMFRQVAHDDWLMIIL
jgi:hypothetical protein